MSGLRSRSVIGLIQRQLFSFRLEPEVVDKHFSEESSKQLNMPWAILFIVWGWLQLLGSLMGYVEKNMVYSFLLEDIMNILKIALPVIAIAFTIYFLVEQRKDKRGKRLRILLISLWIALVVSMVLVNLIQQNVMHEINFELQHPLFMVLTAFAITLTAILLRYRLMIIGGALFGLLALVASYLKLPEQLLMESLAWFLGFVIPGHLLNVRGSKSQ